jgi:formylmethanofuran dehydrogenase subunit E
MREFRCTRNALYLHDCSGRNDIRERQGHYISAQTEEEAWQEMARRYPSETKYGFTVKPHERFDVKIVEVKRDKDGNIIE